MHCDNSSLKFTQCVQSELHLNCEVIVLYKCSIQKQGQGGREEKEKVFHLPKLCFIMKVAFRGSVIKVIYFANQSAISLQLYSDPLRLS